MSNYVFENLWKAVNVILFFVIVYKFAGKQLKDMFEKAYKSLIAQVEEPLAKLLSNREAVSLAKQEVAQAKAKYEKALENQRMLAKEQYDEIIAHAKLVAQNIEKMGKEMVEVEANRLKSQLISGLSSSLISKAEDKLKDVFKDEKVEISYIKSRLERLGQ
ncbi:ATP synthase subunit B family protein [Hydrogenobaculum acidophilum]